MFTRIKIAAASVLIAMGSLAAVPATANAGNVDIDIVFSGVGYGGGWGGGHGPRCSPWKAEAKARNMGLRRAHVTQVGRNKIVVQGKKWGRTHTIVFGRNAHCPVKAAW